MRILLLTQWFDPEPTFKGLLFARELQRRGHEVHVLTGFPNYPGGALYPGYRVRPFAREVMDGISVLRVALYPSHDGSKLHRALNYGTFAATASIAALAIRKPDVAYVYHPPATIGLPAMVLKHVRGVPLVYDVQDLWPETLAATGMLGNPTALRAIGRWMRTVYRAAARVVVLSTGFRDAVVRRGVTRDKVDVISNWADEAQLQPVHPGPDRARQLGFDGKFTVVFAGTMGHAQGLTTVLDVAGMLLSESDIQLVLVGGGIKSAEIRSEAARRGLANVKFLERRPVSEIGEILALADALLVHLKDDPLFAITIPSKTQAYLLAGRPILMGVRGDAAAMVERAEAGLVFEPEDPRQMADAIKKLHGMDPAERARMAESGAAFYRTELSLERGVAQFEKTFEQAALTRPRLAAVERVLDLGASLAASVVLAAPMAVVALTIRKRLGSPVLFRQTRPGRDGQLFDMVKFRTMTDARGESGQPLPDRDRLTSFGAALRRSSVDELPALLNVIRGDMSLVGPRPLLVRYSEFFTEEERIRTLVRPGLTGWAQVNGRNSASWDDRLAMDAWYVRNRSLWLDSKIIVRTAGRVLRRSDVIADPESAMQNLDDERRGRGGAT